MKVRRIEDILGRPFTIRDLVNGYKDDKATNHVVGYGGTLDIRPAYQRNFRYNPDQSREVIKTVIKGFPLNVMYWVKTQNGYEVLDGQQRTISICEYVCGKDGKGNGISVPVKSHNMTFANLSTNMSDIAEDILDYPLEIYVCEGTDSEKLEWFRVINTAGVLLTEQELRNATYSGPWVSSAKAYFSQEKGKGVAVADKDNGKSAPLLSGKWNEQKYLETAISWIANRDGMTIEEYMSAHQNDADASELWMYFNSVITWVRSKFTVYRKEMKGLPWGVWYNECQLGIHDSQVISRDAATIESRIKDLINDDEVQTIKGIYQYVVDGLEKHLSLRQFDGKIAMKVYEDQKHRCPYCDKIIDGHTYPGRKTEYEFEEMEADHIVPWNKGGRTVEENCQMLCKYHNGHKSGN